MKPNQTRYIAALYMRLSKDDEGAEESSSITTQRKMLLSYAKEHNFLVYDEYIDDGWSGTNFERPDFKRMIADIETNKVNLVLTKDLSRLGRDYITAGQYTEIYFPSHGVRYIAINDGYDSDSPYTDIAPFKNLINEMYARDTSRKIRSAFLTKMKDGSYIGNFAPYGYQKDPNNKNHLIIDKETAPIVEEMFQMAYHGHAPTYIADNLNKRGIPTPSVYRCMTHPHLDINNYSKRQEWTSSTVSKMLSNITYTGSIAQRKTTKVSFKSSLSVTNPRDEWIVVDNTHEPIISKDLFEEVRRRAKSRTCEKKGAFFNIFSGLVKCADCGRNMSTVGTRKKGSPANLACGGYKLYGSSECSNHFIDYNVFYEIVLNSIQEQIHLSEQEHQEIATALQKEADNIQRDTTDQKELLQLEKQNKELDALIEKLYEDNFQGIINDDRFQKLLKKYETETQKISDKIKSLSNRIEAKEMGNCQKSYQKFLELVKEYTDIKELNQDLLFKLIDRIEVSQGYYEKAENGYIKHQKIKIYFRFIGTPQTKEYCL